MIQTKQSLDIKAALADLTVFPTHDGNWLAVDPEVGTASGATREEAKNEIERRKAAQKDMAA